MGMNYTLGSASGPGKPPKKVKRTGPKPTGRKEGEESKARRMATYTAEDNKKVNTANQINTKTKKAVDDGLKLNEYGIPTGKQKHRKFNLNRRVQPKFDKSK